MPLQAQSEAAKETFYSKWLIAGGLLVVGFVIGLAFLNSQGTSDRARWLLYMGLAHANSLRATYHIAATNGVGGFPTDYPPLGLMVLGVVARVGGLLGSTDFVALKVSLLLATLGCAVLIAVWNGRCRPLLGAAMFGALFADSMLLAYVDVYFVLVLLPALLFLQRGYLATGTALYAVSILVKWQPIVLAPFVLFYLLREPQRVTFATIIRVLAPTTLVLAVVYLLFGNAVIGAFWRGITDLTFSGSALNLNWLATAAIQWSTGELQRDGGVVHTIMVGGYPTIEYISYALRLMTFVMTLAYFYFSKRHFTDLLQSSLIGFLCYFMFGSGVHENHALIVAILALCLVAADGVGQIQAAVLAAMVNVNLLLFFGLTGTRPDLPRVVFGWDVSIYLSLLNLAIFAVLWTPAAAAVCRHIAVIWRTASHSYSFDEKPAR